VPEKPALTTAIAFFKTANCGLRSLHIAEYSHGTVNNHDPVRERKLLLNRRELKKLESRIKEKGYTVIPLRLVP
jgi:SsrA-binding protein